MKLKETFIGYEHPFDFVIETVKKIRQLKSEYNLSSKTIDNAFIYIKNNEAKLGLILQSASNIKRLCKSNNLYFNYIDESDELNNFYIRF